MRKSEKEINDKMNRFISKTLVKHPELINTFKDYGAGGLVARVPINELKDEL